MSNDIRFFIWDEASQIAAGKEDITTGPHMYKTPRGVVNYAAAFDIPDNDVEDMVYTIPDGKETAKFYAFSQYDITMDTDYVGVSVKPRKQYAEFTISFIEDISDRYQNMRCEITSSSAGVNLYTLQAEKGEFSLTTGFDFRLQTKFLLSRQGFDDLTLVVIDIEKGQKLNEYSLSNILELNGYDWTSPSLKDASITLSLTRQEAFVEIGDWEDGGSFEGGL